MLNQISRLFFYGLLASLLVLPTKNQAQIQTVLAGKAKNLLVRGAVKPDWNAAPSPAITMESLLDDIKTDLQLDGTFKFNSHFAAFLPPTTKKGKKIKYRSNVYVTAKLNQINGDKNKTVRSFTFATEDVLAPMYRLAMKQPGIIPMKLKEGDYQIDYYAFNELFYQFSFSVKKVTSADPYSTLKDFYFLTGPWEDWNYLEFHKDDADAMWYTYIANENIKIKERADESLPIAYRAELFRNDQKLAFHDKRISSGREHWDSKSHGSAKTNNIRRGSWAKQGMQLVHNTRKNPNGYPDKLNRKDFTDGNYVMKVYVEDELREFQFTVSGGEIVKHPMQDRDRHDDPKTLVEGGRDQFWFKRK